jgi:hypothetical protein
MGMNGRDIFWLLFGISIGLFVYWVWSESRQTRQVLAAHDSRLISLEADKLQHDNAAKPMLKVFKWAPVIVSATAGLIKLLASVFHLFGNHL